MGDMADFTNDQNPDAPLYDYGGVKTCRCCKQTGFHWTNSGTTRAPRWVLVDFKGKLHNCPVNPLKGEPPDG
jgi:hypothetical protein